MIDKIGFFSLLREYEQPFELLQEAIHGCADGIRNSLIVLPEAFNYGRSYSEKGRCPKFTAEFAVDYLSELSSHHRITFVAGLLDWPDNSAFLINGNDEPILLRKKTTGEHKEPGTKDMYQPYQEIANGRVVSSGTSHGGVETRTSGRKRQGDCEE